MSDGRDWLTFRLACWGAVVSTSALAWNIWNQMRGRGWLKVDVSLCVLDGHTKEYRHALQVEVVNTGDKPMRVMACVIVGAGRFPLGSEGWTLQPDDHQDALFPMDRMPCPLAGVYVEDVRGGKWRVKRAALKRFNRALAVCIRHRESKKDSQLSEIDARLKVAAQGYSGTSDGSDQEQAITNHSGSDQKA